MDLSLEQVEAIMKEAGAEKVDPDAVRALAKILKDYAEELTEDAVALSKHAGRRIVTADDVRLAKKA